MSENIIQITKWNEKAEAKAKQAAEDTFHEREFLQCIANINRALQKTGGNPRTLAHLFLHMSMIITDGGFDKMFAQEQQKGGVRKCKRKGN